MRIVQVRIDEDCFDKSTTATIEIDGFWTREAIGGLSALGQLDYFPDFPRPFFRLRAPSGWQLKGVEGESTCRLVTATGTDGACEEIGRYLLCA